VQPDQDPPTERSPNESEAESLSFFARFVLAFIVWFRVLFDGRLAAQVKQLAASPEAPRLGAPPPRPALPAAAEPVAAAAAPPPLSSDAALQLLSLLQREGRLVDFVEQDIAAIADSDVAAAARVVHEGCRRALRAHAKLVPIRSEGEGDKIVLEDGFAKAEIQLSGDVRGHAPYQGQLRHHGWRAVSLSLPTPVPGHDPGVIAPAEIEL
jgi:hypothetical protein